MLNPWLFTKKNHNFPKRMFRGFNIANDIATESNQCKDMTETTKNVTQRFNMNIIHDSLLLTRVFHFIIDTWYWILQSQFMINLKKTFNLYQ